MALSIEKTDLDALIALSCEGSGNCRSPLHVHGCYADVDCSRCDDPDSFDDAAPRQGAPRQALDSDAGEQARQAGDRVEQLGVAVSVRQLTPASAGHAVRIVVDGPLWLDPADAHLIAAALDAAALESIHADRAVRHG